MNNKARFPRVESARLTDFLRNLIKVPTVNPPGENYDKIAQLIADEMNSIGFDVELVEQKKGQPNVVGIIKGRSRDKGLILNAHTDVVPPGSGWTVDPFGGEVKSGKIYGRGAADDKSGIAVILAAARAVVDSGVNFAGDLVVAATVNEDTGGAGGLKYLLDSGAVRAHVGAVAETTDMNIKISENGAYWCEVAFKGRSAHGSTPHLGINAVAKAARAVLALQDFKTDKKHPMNGPGAINIGTITGGTKVNMVPDLCKIQIDRRFIPGETCQSAQREIDETIRRLAREDPQIDYEMSTLLCAEPFELSKEEAIVRSMLNAYETALGMPGIISGEPGFCDARFLNLDAGIPTVMFGPGRDDQCHVADEFVETEDLLKATRVYSELIFEILGKSKSRA